MEVAVIGYGAIGSFVVEQLSAEPSIEVVAVFSCPRPNNCPAPVVDDVGALLTARPDLVVECAGHQALRESGAAVLRHGIDLLVVSVGALADASLELLLRKAATDSGSRLVIPGGALGRIDALSTAREAGLESVEIFRPQRPCRMERHSSRENDRPVRSHGSQDISRMRRAHSGAAIPAKRQCRGSTGFGRPWLRTNQCAPDRRSRGQHQQPFLRGAGCVRRNLDDDPIDNLADQSEDVGAGTVQPDPDDQEKPGVILM
jgi:hypothetical protein